MKEHEKVINWAMNALNIKTDVAFAYLPNDIKKSGCYLSAKKVIGISRNINGDKLLETIFHELVHHKQYEINKVQVFAGQLFWRKSNGNYTTLLVQDIKEDFKTYWNSPHEVQARKISKKMLNNYKIMLDSVLA